jgi:lipopolysaccharide transport system ATP-binding protein
LFVSHNMAAVKSLCTRGIVLEHGKVKFDGKIENAVSFYLSGESESQNKKTFSSEYDKKEFRLHEISLNPIGKSSDDVLDEYQKIEINTVFTLKAIDSKIHVTFVLNNEMGDSLFTFSHVNNKLKLKQGLNKIKCTLPEGFLNVGSYYLALYIIENAKTTLFVEKDIMSFNIQEGERGIGSWMGKEPGFIKPKFDWTIEV